VKFTDTKKGKTKNIFSLSSFVVVVVVVVVVCGKPEIKKKTEPEKTSPIRNTALH
jgi:hypothetical protein